MDTYLPKINIPLALETSGSGVPGGIRTPDLLIRSQTLYPAELRAHIGYIIVDHLSFYVNPQKNSLYRWLTASLIIVVYAAAITRIMNIKGRFI
jgi:hypothetical protein